MKHFRFLSLLIALVLCLFALPASAEVTTVSATYTVDAEELGLPSNDELFAYYFEQQLFSEMYGGISTLGTGSASAGSRLTGDAAYLYAVLADKIKDVAANGSTETIYSFGRTINYDGATLVPDFEYTFTETNLTFLESVMNALIADYPYELYWFDKGDEGWTPQGYVSGNTIYLIEIRLSVAKAYQNGAQYTVRSTSDAVKNVVSKATSIVDQNKHLSDRKKLEAYRDYICDEVDYNHDAASSSYTGGYGDPWQLIYVFDEDKTTDVVCEGYSKAFQYLCDLSTFDNAECYTVTGDCGGPHMWNIVKLDGKNYIVDVTNSDPDPNADGGVAVGSNGTLFLVDPVAGGSVEQGYEFDTLATNNTKYIYDDNTRSIWGQDVLTLGSVAIVDDGNDVTYFQDFTDAANRWNSINGSTLTLLQDFTLTEYEPIEANANGLVLDLNGKTLTETALNDTMFIGVAKTLTIKGPGTISGGSTAISFNGEKLTIDGAVTLNGDNYEFRCAYGVIDLTQAANINNWQLYAGGKTITFGYDDNCDVKLPAGYAAVLNGVVVTSISSQSVATITPHTHSHTASYKDNGDGTHTAACACGAGITEGHTYVNGICACTLVKTYTVTLSADGVKIVAINGVAADISDGETFTVPHGQELKLVFKNTFDGTTQTGVCFRKVLRNNKRPPHH